MPRATTSTTPPTVSRSARASSIRCSSSSVDHAALDLDRNLGEQRLRHRARGDRDRGLPRARPLEGVPRVGEAELERPCEIGVPGTRQRDGLRALPGRLALRRPRAHPPGPVRVVAIAHDERERRTESAPVAETRQHLDHVLLQLLARAAPVALLPARKVGVDRSAVEHQPGGKAGQDRHQRRPVRLTRGHESQRHGSKPRALRITPTGASTPVQSRNEAAPCRTSASSPSTTSREPTSRAAATSAVGRPSAR